MSSFDKTAGKNLDEILASIRRTLADETPPHPGAGTGEPNVPAEAKAPVSGSPNGAKGLASKIDEDLADLLAGGLGVPTSAPKDPDPPAAAADQKDPLWFLRPSGGRESQVLPLPADRVSASLAALADAASNRATERSNLAPQCVADTTGASGEPSPAALGPAPATQAAPTPVAAPAAEPRTPIEPKPAAKSPEDAVPPAKVGPESGSPLPEVAGLPQGT